MREPLTDAQIEMIERLFKTSTMADFAIASRFGLSIKEVKALRRSRYWDRDAGFHDAGGPRKQTITEIAKQAGVARNTIQKRLDRGIKGAALAAPRHKTTRLDKRGKDITKRVLQPRTGA
jgi:hypothetical protein